MKNSKKDLIGRMEMEDDLGIRRGTKKRFVVPDRVYILIKIVLIAAIPFAYFICSPLIAVIVLAYFGLIVITNNIEKNFNLGLKKELRIHLPKTDSLLCLLLVIITIAGVVVSSVSMTQRAGMFEGFGDVQLEDVIDEGDFSSADLAWMQIWTKTKEFGTLMTGTRYFFQEQRGFGGFGGFGEDPPEGFTPPSGTDMPDMSELLDNMPFSIIFGSIIKAVDTGMLVVICICGLLSVRKFKKLTK